MSGILNKLKEKNPTVAFFAVTDPEFAAYGSVLDGWDTAELLSAAKEMKLPEEGSLYLPAVERFEQLPIAKRMQEELFGTLPAQVGYCYGCNSMLGASEWHVSSEINIAVTPFVLILGTRSDLNGNRMNSAQMKAFYVPQGAVLEIYATTLHFCPCQVSDDGFGCVVGLPAGTNLPLEEPSANPLLFRRNKWLLAHEKNAGLIARGAVAGIGGENYNIRY